MNLSTKNKKILVNEIRTVCDYMSKASDAKQKMYFFSAVFGIANRIMNIEYDPELGFLHQVTNTAYQTINTNLALAAQGATMTIPKPVFEKLEEALDELAYYIEDGKKTYRVLEKISNLAYSTSGNGYYLYLKGLLKID
jgi:hypothetical protein